MEKTSENELSDKLFKQMKDQFDTIMCVNNYSLDNFTNFLNNIKESDKDKVLENLINEQIFNLKRIATPFNIRWHFIKISWLSQRNQYTDKY